MNDHPETVTKTVLLPVTPDEAFALVTEPERLRRWQTISARVDLRVGGDYRWTIVPGHTAVGTFQEIEPGRRVVFGWGWEGEEGFDADTSTVTVTLTPVEGGTELTLTHTGFLNADQAASHGDGWTHYLGRLETVAAGAVDAGADEWAARPDGFDELSAAEASLAVLQSVARRLTTEDQQKQTPCAEYTCHDVAEHLFGSLTQLGGMAGGTVTRPASGSLEAKLAAMGMEAIDAWKARGTDGTVEYGEGEMPAAFFAAVLNVELLLHAWDLAQGSGKPIVASDELVAYVATLAEQVVPGGRGTAFGDEVFPAADANALDRLAAFAGRTTAAA
ncbi:TIGR03086 family metal-binding protein [Monashia sp. NPDC004114]